MNLLLIALLVPVTIHTTGHFRHSRQSFFMAGFMLMALGFVLGVTEHLALGTLTRDVKNVIYAAGAVCFAVAMIRQNLAVRGGRL